MKKSIDKIQNQRKKSSSSNYFSVVGKRKNRLILIIVTIILTLSGIFAWFSGIEKTVSGQSIAPATLTTQRNKPVEKKKPTARKRRKIASLQTNTGKTIEPRKAALLADGNIDDSFANNLFYRSYSEALRIFLQPDEKSIVIGEFDSIQGVPRTGIARLNGDGTLDASYAPQVIYVDDFDKSIYSAYIEDALIQPDGKLIIAGDFNQVNGSPRNMIVRLNQDGSLDESFNHGFSSVVSIYSMALQPDGKILVDGYSLSTESEFFHRLNADGSIDTEFSPALTDTNIHDFVVQSDGKILLGGSFYVDEKTPEEHLVRLNNDGSRDTAFAPIFSSNDYCNVDLIVLHPDGKIVVLGRFDEINKIPRANIARLNSDGSTDVGFESEANGSATSAVLQPDGKLLLGVFIDEPEIKDKKRGRVPNGKKENTSSITRLNADGTIDTNFTPVSVYNVESIAVESDGQILVGAETTRSGIEERFGLARLNGDGSLDAAYDARPSIISASIFETEIQPDGKIIVLGNFGYVGSAYRKGIVRFNGDGTLDETFNTSIDLQYRYYGTSDVMKIQPDGKIVIVGDFSTVNGVLRRYIVRLNADGSLDESFVTPQFEGMYGYVSVTTFGIDAIGRIIIGGEFNSIDGITRTGLARLLPDGTLDKTFDVALTSANSGEVTHASKIVVQPNGKLLVGGEFDFVNGEARKSLVRLDENGIADAAFNLTTYTYETISDIDLQADGRILMSGSFRINGNGSQRGVTRISSDGGSDASFSPYVAGFGELFAELQADGKILLIKSSHSAEVGAMTRLYPNGLNDSSFDVSFNESASIFDIELQPDGKIILAGEFNTVNEQSRNAIVRLNNLSMTLNIEPLFVYGGQPAVGSLSILNPAPSGGLNISLTSSNSSVAAVPSNIFIPEGSSQVDFPITTFNPVTTNRIITISATCQSTTVNNRLEVQVPRADLVAELTVPSEIRTDESFNVSWKVRNQGQIAVTGTWRDDLAFSANGTTFGTSLGQFPITQTLLPGEEITRTQSVTVPLAAVAQNGTFYIRVTTDALNNISEGTFENNNTSVKSLFVRRVPRPDLLVENITAPDTAMFGQTIRIQWTVKNNSDGATNSDGWYDWYYISSDNVPEIEDPFRARLQNVSYLAAGERYTASADVTIPRGLIGNYKIIVWTDSDGSNHRAANDRHNVFESNELNNFALNHSITINAPPLPDLQVPLVQAPEEGFAGQAVSLGWRVENRGTGSMTTDQNTWTDDIFLSHDTTFNPTTDRYIGSRVRQGRLLQNQGYDVTNFSVNLPNNISGNWYVFVRTDSKNDIYEFNSEGNNTNYDRQQPGSPIVIRATPPDLIVQTFNAPSTGQAGRTVNVGWTVKNQGAFPAPSSWVDTIYLSADATPSPTTDTPLSTISRHQDLEPGANYTASANVTIPDCLSGNQYLYVFTDSRNVLYEFDPTLNAEANNFSQLRPIALTSLPSNLQVTSIVNPSSGSAGQPVNISWSVKNNGTDTTFTDRWNDQVYLSPTATLNPATAVQLGTFQHEGALNSNESYTRSENVLIPVRTQGSYFLIVTTDSGNRVNECAGENNNQTTSAVSINIGNDLPDLNVTDFAIASNLVAGQVLNLQWTVSNSGAVSVQNRSWNDAVYFSTNAILDPNDLRLTVQPITGPLATNSSYTKQAQITTPVVAPGNYFLIVKTDNDDNIFEGTGNDNNIRILPISFETPLIDLQVTNVDVPANAYSGLSMTVNWSVLNSGTNQTVGSQWTDSVVISLDPILDPTDRVIGYKQHEGTLNGGASYTDSLAVNIPSGFNGFYYIFVKTDRNNQIAESNENNNTGLDGLPLELPPPANLSVTGITAPSNGSPGEPLTINWTVQNSGGNPVLGLWSDAVYLSTDSTWDIGDVLIGYQSTLGPVAPGQSYDASLSVNLPGINLGQYRVIVRADIRNRVRETDENNNSATAATTTNIDAVELPLGATINTTLLTGQERYYKTTVPADETIKFSIVGQNDSYNELFTRLGLMVDRSSYDYQFSRLYEPNQETIVPNSEAGYYSTLARSTRSVPQTQNVTMKAEIIPFSITSVSTNRIGDNGQVTITLRGARFQNGATVKLIRGATTLTASKVIVVDSTTAKAQFIFTDAPHGAYDVTLTNPGNQSTSAVQAVTIETTVSNETKILGVANNFPVVGREFRWSGFVTNAGNVDIQYLTVGVNLSENLPVKMDYPAGSLMVDTTNPDSPPTFILKDVPPGEKIDFTFRVTNYRAPFNYFVVPSAQSKNEFVTMLMDTVEAVRLEILNNPSGNLPIEIENALLSSQTWWELTKSYYVQLGVLEATDNIKFTVVNAEHNRFSLSSSQCEGDCFTDFYSNFTPVAAGAATAIALGGLPALVPAVAGVGVATAGLRLNYEICICRCLRDSGSSCGAIQSLFCRATAGYACPQNPSDPNDKHGPSGFGSEAFVGLQEPLPYTINFENMATATAYAQRVRITDQLDPNLDWRTFRVKEIGFGSYRIKVPENRAFFQQRIQLGAEFNNLLADINAGIDIATGKITWTLTAIDPTTGEQPNDADLGLLAPNDATGRGQGFVSYTIQAKSTAATGSVINNSATIVFDTEEPINTNIVSNTLDADLPESQVVDLPSTSEPTITISWTGSDPASGAGLHSYDVFVSENGATYHPLVSGTTEASTQFTGVRGKTYRFYSIARDNAGNVEEIPLQADAATTIVGGAFEADVAPRPNGNNNGSVTVADLTQIGRFVAGIDTPDQPTATNEFQRTDTAPRSLSGNGTLTVADITQAGRYVAGLDPLQAAGGAISASFGDSSRSAKFIGAVREIRPVRISRTANKLIIGIELNTEAGSPLANAIGFSVNFNPAVLSNPSNISLGSGAGGATLISNTGTSAQGRLGIVVYKAANQTFPAGAQQLVTIEFDVINLTLSATTLDFGDQPVVRDVSDVNASSLPTSFAPRSISLVAPTAAHVEIGGRVANAKGVAIKGARITMVDSAGRLRTAMTNSFGIYRLEDVEVGSSVTISVAAKGYTFNPGTQLLTVNEENHGIDFVADE